MCQLTDKLRSYSPASGYARWMREAADEIDRLRKINAELEDEARLLRGHLQIEREAQSRKLDAINRALSKLREAVSA